MNKLIGVGVGIVSFGFNVVMAGATIYLAVEDCRKSKAARVRLDL